MTPKQPAPGRGWQPTDAPLNLNATAQRWLLAINGGLISVISAVETIERSDVVVAPHAEHHVSVSWLMAGRVHRLSDAALRRVVADFGLVGFDEDNHVPGGKVRNLWRAVSADNVGECECVNEAAPTVDPFTTAGDGGDYVWRP